MSNYLTTDTDLTAVANAIRTKGGTSASLAFPADFVSAIQNLPSGGGALNGITSVIVGSSVETSLTASFPNLTSLSIGRENNFSIQTIDITAGSSEITLTAGGSASAKGGALKTIDLHGAKVLISDSYGLRYRENLETVNAKVRVTTSNANNQFNNTSKLQTIYWQENAQTINLNISACPLDNDSLVSLANGLSGTTTATLTLSSARKTTCGTIMGTVSQKTVGGVTYDFFTQDAQGTVSLTSFITTTKGWTLA